jgi:anti-sigma B factor antagonist
MQLTDALDSQVARFGAEFFESDEGTVLRLSGELDLAVAQPLEAIALRALEKSDHEMFYVDVSNLSFCGSQGLSLFVRIDRVARDLGHRFVLRGPRPMLTRLLVVTALDQQLTVEP